ncbi:hypothetical protein KKF25_00125, partial [Patescibacteria group bacterium]|nr:hypothetical protein [Patescibacteria group bacterium]
TAIIESRKAIKNCISFWLARMMREYPQGLLRKNDIFSQKPKNSHIIRAKTRLPKPIMIRWRDTVRWSKA